MMMMTTIISSSSSSPSTASLLTQQASAICGVGDDGDRHSSTGNRDCHNKNQYRDRRRHSRGNSSNNDSISDSNSSSNLATLILDVEGGDGDGAGKGEQTAVLDAAAAYMARMEHYLHCNNSDASSTTPANNMICQQNEDEDTNDNDDWTNAIDENHEIARDQDDCAGNYNDDDGITTKEKDGCGSRPIHSSNKFNDGEINESESGSVIIGSSTTTGSTHNNPGNGHEMAKEEEVDDSFYIGEEDGFCNSSSVHESDISVTDSEAYENNHRSDDDDHDDDVQDSKDNKSDNMATSLSAIYSNDIMVNNDTGNVTSIRTFGEATDYRDNDNTANNLWMHDRDELRNNEKFRLIGVMSPPEAEDTSIEETVVINDSAPLPATTTWDEKCDDVGKVATIKSTTTVSSTKMQHEVMMPNSPPSALLEALADVKTPSRHTSPRPPQTPPPSTCSSRHDYVTTSLKQMLYQQESELSQMMLSIDALSSTPGRIARLCDEEIVGEDDYDDDYDMVLCGDELEYNLDDGDGRNKHELYLVKKRLMIDSNNDHNGTSRKEKRMLEPLEEEGHLKLCEENDCVNSSSFVRKDLLETSTATKELETSMTPAWPKTPSIVDVTMRSEMNSPAIHFTGRSDEAPLIAIPPSRSTLSVPTWQKNLHSCGSPNSSPLASHAKEPLPPNQINSRCSPSTHSCKQSTPSRPSSSDLNEQGWPPSGEVVDAEENNRTDILSVCKTSAEKFEEKQNPEFMPSGSTENEEHDIEVPDTIQKLFRDADTLLQNFLASPDLAGKGMGEGYYWQAKDPHLVAASKEGSDEQFENEEVTDEWSLLPIAGPTVENEEEKQSEGAHSLQDDTLAADAFQTKLSISKDEHKIMVSNESAADSDKRVCGDAIVAAIPEKDSFFNASSTPPKTKNLASTTSFVNSVDDTYVDTCCNLDSGNHFFANETFDTAIGSLGRLGKDFDHFFDAKEMMDDNTPADGSFDDMQCQKGNIYGIVFAAEEDTNGNAIESADGVDLIELNEVPSLEQARDAAFSSQNVIKDNLPEKLRADYKSEILSEIVEVNAANQPKSNSDVLTMNNHLRNFDTGHFSIPSVKSDSEPTSTYEEVGVSDPIESISQTVSNETTVSTQAIDEEKRNGQSNLGILDESVLNESIFMPNVSNDAKSNSAESPDRPLTSAGLLTSEDESEVVDDSDDEAFFPNLDFTSRTKVAAAATENSRIEKDQPPVSKCSHMPAITAVSSIETKQAVIKLKSTAAAIHSSSRSLPPSKVPLRQNTTRNVSLRANPLPPRERAREHPTSSASMKFPNRSSSSDSLPERNRKVSPTWSPPSGMKPAKKRSRSLNVVSSAPAEGNKEKSKRSSLADMSLRATSGHGTNLAPEKQRSEAASRRCQGNKLTVRGKRESRESMGKENNQVENTTGRLKAGIESSRSMKQSLVSVTRARRQSESQLPSRPTRQKNKIDMERLTRLAEPRHRRSVVPPLNNDSPAKSVNKDAQTSAPGPPSFLSRTSSRPRVKSSAELETEEMERMKPFKAQTIRGCSIAIKSRYKTATKLPIPSSRAFAPSPSYEPESTLVPPTAPKPPASHPNPPASHHRRESALYKPTPVRKQVQTFGESVQHYLNHGLRNSLPSPQIALMSSTPKPPSFLHRQSLSNNAAIKSSEEIELEECQKQFRARAISFGSTPITVIHRQGQQMPVPRQFPPAQRQWRETPKREKPRALTTPSPFRLHTNLRAESNRPTLLSADEFELSKKFRALPLPNSSTRFFRGNDAVDVPYHIRAQQQYELAKQRKETITKDIIDEYDGSFKARPVPKTTYEAMPLIKKNVRMQISTQPKPPRLSLSGRAEARKLFDQHSEEARKNKIAMKQQKKQQQKEIEEEEIQRKRRSYADEGGFCFKARQIRIEYM